MKREREGEGEKFDRHFRTIELRTCFALNRKLAVFRLKTLIVDKSLNIFFSCKVIKIASLTKTSLEAELFCMILIMKI